MHTLELPQDRKTKSRPVLTVVAKIADDLKRDGRTVTTALDNWVRQQDRIERRLRRHGIVRNAAYYAS